jgi:hypothetical protein
MPKRLNGSAGTGKKIMQNKELFKYTYNGSEQLTDNSGSILHKFEWTFGNQSGFASIILLPGGIIDQFSLLRCTRNQSEFVGSLGAYNDESLYEVFEIMLRSQKIPYTQHGTRADETFAKTLQY